MTGHYSLAFLLANWYSGATVLNILLNNHSQVVSNGEAFPFHVSDETIYTCSCGSRLDQCQFYRAAGAHMLAGDDGWNQDLFAQLPRYSGVGLVNKWLLSYRRRSRLRDFALSHVPSFRRIHSAFVVAHEEFFRNAASAKSATLYLDGTKSFRRAEIFAGSTDAAIYVLRDGRGFCNSFRKHQDISAGGLAVPAHQWLEHIAALREFESRNPEVPVLTIRYEDLCNDLEGTMRKACSALGLPFEERVLGRQLEDYHLLGNRMRMDFDGTVKEDRSWETALTAEEIRFITDIMRPELERFGYL